MSLYSALQTSVSGMAAQANALSAVSDNIANSSTAGYKEASTEFETVLGNSSKSSYESGGVLTDTRYAVTQQGTPTSTSSSTDLDIQGSGFFVVSDAGQGSYLTRAGSFAPDGTGNLVNAAGYSLMGYAIGAGGVPSTTLSVVNVAATALQASASTIGTLSANLPAAATGVASANLPSSSNSSSTASSVDYTEKASITAYDHLGAAVNYDVYYTNVANAGGTPSNTWEVTAYNAADAASGGGFPYSTAPVAVTTLTFDPTTGGVASAAQSIPATTPAGTSEALSIAVPNGNTISVDLSGMTQFASAYSPATNKVDGNAPSKLSSVAIGTDGTLTDVYANGTQIAAYKIPVATVNSPDNLSALSGNVYTTNTDSGNMVLQTPGTNGAGTLLSDSLESSTVDLATELTNMIQAQRGYEANSKVLQASSDLLHTLTQLQL